MVREAFRPRDSIPPRAGNETPETDLPSSFFGRGSVCKGAASSFRPKIIFDRRGGGRCDPPRSLSSVAPASRTAHTTGGCLETVSVLSAIGRRIHAVLPIGQLPGAEERG